MIFFMLTDIHDEQSIVIYDGERAEDLLREAFGVTPDREGTVLPGVVSRKKQLIPALLNALRKL